MSRSHKHVFLEPCALDECVWLLDESKSPRLLGPEKTCRPFLLSKLRLYGYVANTNAIQLYTPPVYSFQTLECILSPLPITTLVVPSSSVSQLCPQDQTGPLGSLDSCNISISSMSSYSHTSYHPQGLTYHVNAAKPPPKINFFSAISGVGDGDGRVTRWAVRV